MERDSDVQTLLTQYHKALDGLYEAYRFGAMLLRLKLALEGEGLPGAFAAPGTPENASESGSELDPPQSPENQGFSGVLTRENARERGIIGNNGNALCAGGWNAGLGLRGWLAAHVPEVTYKTAMRFLAIAEVVQRALAPMPGEVAEAPLRWEPEEEAVRAYLAGKSQRQVLRLGGSRAGAGRKAKPWTSPEAAWKRLEEALEPLNALLVQQRLDRLLTADDRATLRAALALLLLKVDEPARGVVSHEP